MNKSTLAIAVAVGLLAQQASAAGFIEDSKATLKLRNFYINNDNRDSGAPKNSNYTAEWGQGFQLDYTSGFTQGTVGFGVDAIGLLGVKLDSSAAKHGNPTGLNAGGSVFPSDGNHAVDDFSSLGLTAKAKISQTELRIGTLQPKLPVIVSNDGRLLPQTFQGGQITSSEFKDLTFTGGQIEHAKGRNSSNNEGLSLGGANGSSNYSAGKFVNKFYYGGVDYKLNKDLLLQYYYGNLEDFYKQHFLGLTHNWSIGPGVLKSDLRYFNSSDDGKNGNEPAYYTTGDYHTQANGKGKVDNRLWSAMFTYALSGHSVSLGYQKTTGESDFPHINQGQGRSLYLITNSQSLKFVNAGEQATVGSYAYDFAGLGVPGLRSSVTYIHGSHIRTVTRDNSEWERDLRVDYVIPTGTFKGLGLTWRSAVLRGNDTADKDETRLIVSYSIPLL